MKNAIGILLLICLVVPTSSTYVWYKFHQKKIKKEVKESMIVGIGDDELVLLRFAKDETQTAIRWEHEREFEYQGEMYDVVKTTVEDDSIYFLCWPDQEETQLNQQLSELLNDVWEKDIEHKDRQIQLLSFFQSLFYSHTTLWHSPEHDSIWRNPHDLETYASLTFSPPVPPPILF